MEYFTQEYKLSGSLTEGQRIVCGVVGSGNLEVIVESNDAASTVFQVQTAVDNFQAIWELVIQDFVHEQQPVGLIFTINDNGASPPIVSLRLRQALEMYSGYKVLGKHYLELKARDKIASLVDEHSFREWLTDEKYYSPHLKALGLTW